MILGLIIGLSVGAILGFFVMGLLVAASRGEAMVHFEDATADPYDTEERQERIDRALARENVVPLGHIRLGQQKATHFDDVFTTRRWHP